jgi:hypothetical protein
MMKAVLLMMPFVLYALADPACNSYDTIKTCQAHSDCAWSHWGCVSKKFSAAMASENMHCGHVETAESFTVVNNVAPGLKIRMCDRAAKSDAPASSQPVGAGCSSNPADPVHFDDCAAANVTKTPERIPQGSSAVLTFDSAVESIIFVTYDAIGQYNETSYCYWNKPAAGWPASTKVDDAFWRTLSMSCTPKTAEIEPLVSNCKTDTDCQTAGDMSGYCKANGDCHCSAPHFGNVGTSCSLVCSPNDATNACCRTDDDCQKDGDVDAYCKSLKGYNPGNGMCRCSAPFSGTTSCTKSISSFEMADVMNVACKNPSTCLQLNIPGGVDNPFWKANSYKYDPSKHPECSKTACGSEYPQFESVIHDVQGFKGVDLVKYGIP